MKKWIGPSVAAVLVFTGLFFAFKDREFPYENAVWVESFTLTGIFMLFASAFIVIDRFGAFDVAAYGVKKIVRIFKKVDAHDDFPSSYFEYKEQRNDREKASILPLFLPGVLFLLIGILIYLL